MNFLKFSPEMQAPSCYGFEHTSHIHTHIEPATILVYKIIPVDRQIHEYRQNNIVSKKYSPYTLLK